MYAASIIIRSLKRVSIIGQWYIQIIVTPWTIMCIRKTITNGKAKSAGLRRSKKVVVWLHMKYLWSPHNKQQWSPFRALSPPSHPVEANGIVMVSCDAMWHLEWSHRRNVCFISQECMLYIAGMYALYRRNVCFISQECMLYIAVMYALYLVRMNISCVTANH